MTQTGILLCWSRARGQWRALSRQDCWPVGLCTSLRAAFNRRWICLINQLARISSSATTSYNWPRSTPRSRIPHLVCWTLGLDCRWRRESSGSDAFWRETGILTNPTRTWLTPELCSRTPTPQTSSASWIPRPSLWSTISQSWPRVKAGWRT